LFFCGAASASQVSEVNLEVDPGIAGQDQVWNVSFVVGQFLYKLAPDKIFITFDQDFTADTYFNPDCITVTYDGQSAHPDTVTVFQNINNTDYPLYENGTTTVLFDTPLDIAYNDRVLITFDCGIHTPCPINCSGYHVWANTNKECTPSISNEVYLQIPITAVSGTNGTVKSPDGSISPPYHTEIFDCGETPLYVITPDPFFSIAEVEVDSVSVVDTPGYVPFPDGHAEYTFPPLTCYHIFEAEFKPGGNLTINKTADQEIVSPGEIFTYHISYGNLRPFTAEDVTIIDILPEELEFVSAPGGTFNGTAVIWELDDLDPGETGMVNLTVEVEDDVESTTIINCATIFAEELPSQTSCTEVNVYRLEFEKESSVTQAVPGLEFVYTLEFRNPGDYPVTGVTITDELPPELIFVSASDGGTYDGTSVNWTIGTLPGMAEGDVTFTVMVKDTVGNGTQILNCGVIDSDQTVPRTACVLVPVVSPEVPELTKTATEYIVSRNQTYSYIIHFRNPNLVSLTGVYLLDPLPDDLEFVSASDGGALEGQTVNWSIGTISPGEFGDRTLTVRVDEDAEEGNITNCATIYTDQTDPVENCVDVTVIEIIPELEKTASVDNVTREQTFSYTIDWENPSGFSLTGATLVDILPAGLEFVSATDPYTFNGTAVIWDLGTIAPYEEGNVTLTVETEEDAEGTITNCATLFTDFTEPVESCTDVHVMEVVPELEKTASVNNVTREQTFTYTIDWENPSGFNLTRAVVTDSIPEGLEFVNATGDWTIDDSTITWYIGTIGPDEEGYVTLTVKVDDDAPAGIITNCANLLTDETATVQDCTDVTVIGCVPAVELEKTSSQPEVAPGESFVYTINYENSCCANLTGVVVSDHLPNEVVFVSATHGGVYDGNNVTWVIGNVPACAEGELEIIVQVPLIINDPAVDNVVTFFSDQITVSAVDTTVINPARIPDPHKVLVYPPTARFVALPSSGSSPLSVKFMDFSTGSPTAWLWDFGDNTTSHLRSPTHLYTSAGTYTVTLTAMNDWGANTVIKQNLIKVAAPQSSSGTGSGGSILDRIRPPWYHG